MSEYRPKSESDAVLASVRRLVAAEPMPALVAERTAAEKLLLTPAYRIEETAAAQATMATDDATVSLEQRIAELEAAVSGQPGDWEPDGSEVVDEETPHRFVFQHTPRYDEAEEAVLLDEPLAPAHDEATPKDTPPEATTVEAIAADVTDDGEEPRGRTVEIGDDVVVDEDMLRDIVAEIVRSELQGELGERITRNVRKLVRREIHRAIMTRDFG